MGFQSTVRIDQTDAVVGEVRFGSPMSVQPANLLSTAQANNVVGRAFQHVPASDLDVTADAQAAGIFAGILIHPKAYALVGTTVGTLEASLQINNNTTVELLTQGTITVSLATAGNIGDFVYYNFSTGVLSAAAPTANAPAGTTRLPGGFVTRQNIPTAGLAYIKVGVVA